MSISENFKGAGLALLQKAFLLARKIKPARERVTLGEFNDYVEREHVARYRFAQQFCRDKVVADMACGTGYGSQMLRELATSVDSYDKELLCGNTVLNLDRESWSKNYDVIVSFETIEHLERPDFFLANVAAHCKEFLVSTPIGELPGYNPHHKQTWSLEEFKQRLDPYFTYQIFLQDGEAIEPPKDGKCRFVVAVCKNRKNSQS